MYAERLLQSICVPSLVLVAEAVFLLERGQTDKHTDTHVQTHVNALSTPVTRIFYTNLLIYIKQTGQYGIDCFDRLKFISFESRRLHTFTHTHTHMHAYTHQNSSSKVSGVGS